MIKTIILDLDGPILDGRYRHYQCYSDILLENGYAPMPLDRYWEMKRNRVNRHEQLAISGSDRIYDNYLKAWIERIEKKKYLALDRLQPGVIEKLQEWKSNDIRLILTTLRNNKANLRWQLKLLDLLVLFDHVVVGGMTNATDNKANKVKQYISKGDTEFILWIGDTEVDVFAARQLGIKVCVVCCGLRTFDYLTSLNPDLLYPDVNSIYFSKEG